MKEYDFSILDVKHHYVLLKEKKYFMLSVNDMATYKFSEIIKHFKSNDFFVPAHTRSVFNKKDVFSHCISQIDTCNKFIQVYNEKCEDYRGWENKALSCQNIMKTIYQEDTAYDFIKKFRIEDALYKDVEKFEDYQKLQLSFFKASLENMYGYVLSRLEQYELAYETIQTPKNELFLSDIFNTV
jgi:hypothetical protein